MTKVANDLIYEVLKDIQLRLTHVDNNTRDLVKGQLSIRKDINGLERHSLRHEATFVDINERLQGIERRFMHVDA